MPILVFSDSSIHDGETLTPPGSHTVLLLLAASGAQDLCLQGSEDRHRAHSTGSLCQGQQWGRNLFQSRTQPPPTPAAEKQGIPSHSRDFFGSPFLSCPSEVALSYIWAGTSAISPKAKSLISPLGSPTPALTPPVLDYPWCSWTLFFCSAP